MGTVETFLIIAGVVVFALGYFLPAGKNDIDENVQLIGEDEVKKLVNKEVEGVKEHISDIVDETVSYAIEKTERSMERLTNEKIMAVNEYSDTVLDEINKNHKEVLFLYDMLNDKHENLKSTVSEAVKTAEEVTQKVKDAEITVKEAATMDVDEFAPISPARVKVIHNWDNDYAADESDDTYANEVQELMAPPKRQITTQKLTAAKNMEALLADVSPAEAKLPEDNSTNSNENARNSNDRILELHKAGKSNMAIARELGLGIGEVKLVIDLFEGLN